MSVFSDSMAGLVLAMSGDGTGAGIVSALTGSFQDGTAIASAGMKSVTFNVRVALVSVDATITVRVIKRTKLGLGDMEQQTSLQTDPEETLAEHLVSASERFTLELNLRGTCDVIVLQAMTSGGIAAGDYVLAGMDFSHGET